LAQQEFWALEVMGPILLQPVLIQAVLIQAVQQL
jgi:hypothetical protein